MTLNHSILPTHLISFSVTLNPQWEYIMWNALDVHHIWSTNESYHSTCPTNYNSSFVFSMYTIDHQQTHDPSISIIMPFVSFSCLTVWLESLVRCWIEVVIVGIVSFLISWRKLQYFTTEYVSCRLHLYQFKEVY